MLKRAQTLLAVATLCASAQTIEVATIKPTAPNTMDQMFAVNGEHRLFIVNRTLSNLIALTNDLQEDQVLGGPRWIKNEAFDITALPPSDLGNPTFTQWKALLRPMLAERFALQTHKEKRTLSAFVLSTSPDGPTLRPSTSSPSDLPDVTIAGPGHLRVTNATIDDVIPTLACCILHRPIIDQTGLRGRYTWKLDWTPDDLNRPVDAGSDSGRDIPNLYTAMRETLGLRIKSEKGPVDVIIIDHAQQPMAN